MQIHEIVTKNSLLDTKFNVNCSTKTAYNFVKCTKLKIILLNYERKYCNLLAYHDV